MSTAITHANTIQTAAPNLARTRSVAMSDGELKALSGKEFEKGLEFPPGGAGFVAGMYTAQVGFTTRKEGSMPTIADLLQGKGTAVHTIHPSERVLDAARRMNERRVGSLIVVDEHVPDHVVGIITERDILTRVVAAEKAPATTAVADVMTGRVLTCTGATDIEEVRTVMREKRIRHLPVVNEHGRLCGMVSIGDLNQAHVRVLAETVQYLEMYSVRM
jgi:CBS domain-containing protein